MIHEDDAGWSLTREGNDLVSRRGTFRLVYSDLKPERFFQTFDGYLEAAWSGQISQGYFGYSSVEELEELVHSVKRSESKAGLLAEAIKAHIYTLEEEDDDIADYELNDMTSLDEVAEWLLNNRVEQSEVDRLMEATEARDYSEIRTILVQAWSSREEE